MDVNLKALSFLCFTCISSQSNLHPKGWQEILHAESTESVSAYKFEVLRLFFGQWHFSSFHVVCICAFCNVVCLQLTSKESIQGFIMAFAVKIT